MEIMSGMEGSNDDGDHPNPVGNEDSYPDTSAFMECALAHNISLDLIVNTEDDDFNLEDDDEDTDPREYIDTDSEEGFEVRLGEGDEGPTEFKFNCGFDGVEHGIVPPPPACHEPCGRLETGNQRSHRYTVVCVWTKEA